MIYIKGQSSWLGEKIVAKFIFNVKKMRFSDIPLRSDQDFPTTVGGDKVDDFILPNSFVAIAAGREDSDTVWFVKVIDVNLTSTKEEEDDYKNVIPAGNVFISGNFLERDTVAKKSVTYKINENKIMYLYKESIVYPFVNFKEKKDSKLALENEDYSDIFIWVETNGLIHI